MIILIVPMKEMKVFFVTLMTVLEPEQDVQMDVCRPLRVLCAPVHVEKLPTRMILGFVST